MNPDERREKEADLAALDAELECAVGRRARRIRRLIDRLEAELSVEKPVGRRA